MNNDLYFDLVWYLGKGRVPEGVEEWRKNVLLSARRTFELEDAILYKITSNQERRIVIPEKHKDKIIIRWHNHPLSGHMGISNTLYNIQTEYWWPKMENDIQDHIRICDTCQKRKTNKDRVPLETSRQPTKPFEHIGIDVMGPLPRTLTGKRYIILAIDWFSKWTEAEAVEEADAQTITKFLYYDIITRHGVPQEITSDRGTEFLNKLVEEMTRTYRVKHIKTTAYHPQGNSLTERMNQTVKNTLAKLTQKEAAWDHYLPSALFAVRTIRQETTRFSPFELVYGRHPRREIGVTTKDTGSHDDRIWSYLCRDLERLQRIRKKAKEFIDKVQERRRLKNNDENIAQKLGIGDAVLAYRNIVESSWSAKLDPKWDGPYLIQDIKGTSVWLRDPTKNTILSSPVHRTKVKKYYDPHSDHSKDKSSQT